MPSFVKMKEALSDGGSQIRVGLIHHLCLEGRSSAGLPGARAGMGPHLRKGLTWSLPRRTKPERAVSVSVLSPSHFLLAASRVVIFNQHFFFFFLLFFFFLSLLLFEVCLSEVCDGVSQKFPLPLSQARLGGGGLV